MATALNNAPETRKELGKELTPGQKEHHFWAEEVKNSKKLFRDWFLKFDEVVKRYRDERGEVYTPEQSNQVRRYNALWSITQTMLPNIYSDLPNPFFARKFGDADAAARDAALILERAVTAELEGDELADACEEASLDYTLGARGVIWMKYGAQFELRESEDKSRLAEDEEPPEDVEEGDVQVDDEGRYYKAKYEKKIGERIDWEQVPLKNFLHGPSGKWKHVPWVARMVPMTRDELVKRFKDIGKEVPLTLSDKPKQPESDVGQDSAGLFAKAEVWEIWDRTKRKIVWMAPEYQEELLDRKEDLYGLCDFFPCPKPAFGTMTNDRLDPVPDYMEWQDIAIELDDVTFRIKLLTEALRVVGVYNAEHGEALKKVLGGKENDLIPVENWAMFAEGGGLKSGIDWFPIEQIAKVLDSLIKQRTVLVQELYEITGIADVVRGTSDPRDTATAQEIKGQSASKRMKPHQKRIARMIRGAFIMMAEVIAEHYDERTVMLQSDAQQLFLLDDGKTFDIARWQAAYALIKSDDMRRFRIKLDSETLGADEWNKQAEEVQVFIQSTGTMLQQAIPLARDVPALASVAKELIMLGVRRMRAGRAIEATLERSLERLVHEARNQPPDAQKAPAAGKSPQEIEVLQKSAETERQRVGVERQRLLIEERKNKDEKEVKLAKIRSDEQIAKYKIDSDQKAKQMAESTKAHVANLNVQDSAADRQADQQNADKDRMEQRSALAVQEQSKERDRQFGRQETIEDRQLTQVEGERDRQQQAQESEASRKHELAASSADRKHASSEAERDRKSAAAAAKSKSSARK